jgi:hypothetical protein
METVMKLLAVSLTGADDGVDPQALKDLSEKFPLVEWAILSSAARAGTPRYPTEAWVERFHETCPNVRKALHLCGKDVDAFIAQDARILEKVSKFDRVQLNFNQRRQPKDLAALADVANSVKPFIILQYNSANFTLWPTLRNKIYNSSFLFDSSGGGGRSPENGWPKMLPVTLCGYGGGIGPDNIETEFAEIARIAGDDWFWIDMEGKLREPETDRFSLDACEHVLTHVHAVHMAANPSFNEMEKPWKVALQ